MKMRKRVKMLLDTETKVYEANKNILDREFVGGANGKKIAIAACVARTSILRHLLDDEKWEKKT